MNRFTTSIMVFTVALATQAVGQTANPPVPPAATTAPATRVGPVAVTGKPAKGSPDEVICKVQGETGSRLGGHKTCYTRAQWDELSRSAHDDLQRAQQVVQMPH